MHALMSEDDLNIHLEFYSVTAYPSAFFLSTKRIYNENKIKVLSRQETDPDAAPDPEPTFLKVIGFNGESHNLLKHQDKRRKERVCTDGTFSILR